MKMNPGFDFDLLPKKDIAFVREKTQEIHALAEKTSDLVVEIGKRLIEIKARLGHGHWNEWLENEWPFDVSLAPKWMKVAAKFGNFPDLNIGRSAKYVLASDSTPEFVREEFLGRAQAGEEIRHKEVKQAVLNHRSVHFSSKTDQYTTDPEVVELIEETLGKVDLDPASDVGKNIPAKKHFTECGLEKPWHGKVFLNPPYGAEISEWVEKLCVEYESARVTEAIALVPARTDTTWFRRFRVYPRLFWFGRMRFGICENSAPFPSALVYLGPNETRFMQVFKEKGDFFRWIEPTRRTKVLSGPTSRCHKSFHEKRE